MCCILLFYPTPQDPTHRTKVALGNLESAIAQLGGRQNEDLEVCVCVCVCGVVSRSAAAPWGAARICSAAAPSLGGVDAIPWDAATPMCLWVPQFLRTPQLQSVFGFLQFDVFGDSREFCNSDIVVPLTRMQAEGKSS